MLLDALDSLLVRFTHGLVRFKYIFIERLGEDLLCTVVDRPFGADYMGESGV